MKKDTDPKRTQDADTLGNSYQYEDEGGFTVLISRGGQEVGRGMADIVPRDVKIAPAKS